MTLHSQTVFSVRNEDKGRDHHVTIPPVYQASRISPAVEAAIGKLWKKMAKAEGHRKGVPISPRNAENKAANLAKRKQDIYDVLVECGPATSTQIKQFVNLSRACVNDYLLRLEADGKAVRCGYRPTYWDIKL